jgi:hypothetical protein
VILFVPAETCLPAFGDDGYAERILDFNATQRSVLPRGFPSIKVLIGLFQQDVLAKARGPAEGFAEEAKELVASVYNLLIGVVFEVRCTIDLHLYCFQARLFYVPV